MSQSECEWHRDEMPCSYDPGETGDYLQLAYCPECAAMLATRECSGCSKSFLDWEYNGFDDVMAGPSVTEAGDLVCVRCARRIAREEEEEAELTDPWW